MSFIGEQILLRAYLQSADRAPHLPTHEQILQAAQREKLAGVTVLRGILGSGYHALIQSSRWSLIDHVPIILEIVDSAEKIQAFVRGSLGKIMKNGIVTLERAAVLLYRAGPDAPSQPLQLAQALAPLSTLPKLQPDKDMKINDEGVLLRVFIGEGDKFEDKPLYESIVRKARELGLAGSTVLRGSEGFGLNSIVHRAGLLTMSSDLPIVVELIDTEEKIQLVLPHLQAMVKDGLVTMEYVTILIYRHDQNRGD